MIGFATKEMIPDLTNLWCECFTDWREFANFVYQERFRPEQTLVDVRDGHPVAMLWLLPAEILQKGVYQPLWYVYAVATAKAWRGKHISTDLLHHAANLAREQGGMPTILTPANDELFGFYRERGYHDAFPLRIEEFELEPERAEEQQFTLTAISPRMYQQLRDARFEREGYVRWDEDAIAYALRENRFNKGISCLIESPHGRDLALCVKEGDLLLVKETTLPDAALRDGLSKIARRMGGCTHVRARLASDANHPTTHFAMADATAAIENGYLNLVLD